MGTVRGANARRAAATAVRVVGGRRGRGHGHGRRSSANGE